MQIVVGYRDGAVRRKREFGFVRDLVVSVVLQVQFDLCQQNGAILNINVNRHKRGSVMCILFVHPNYRSGGAEIKACGGGSKQMENA